MQFYLRVSLCEVPSIYFPLCICSDCRGPAEADLQFLLLVEPTTAACESSSVTYVSSYGLSPTTPAPSYLLEKSLYQRYNRTLRDPRNLPCITG